MIFDIDDTLYNQLTIFENAYNEVFKRYYNFYVSDIFKSNIKYAGECFEKKEAGTMSTEEMYRYRITKAFGDYGINISTDDSEKFQQSYMKQQKLIKITEGIAAAQKECIDKSALAEDDKLIGIEGDVVAKYIAKKNLLAAVQIGHFFFGNNGVGSR